MMPSRDVQAVRDRLAPHRPEDGFDPEGPVGAAVLGLVLSRQRLHQPARAAGARPDMVLPRIRLATGAAAVLVAALATVLVVVGLPGGQVPSAQAATPRPLSLQDGGTPAATDLRAIATSARAALGTPRGRGDYQFVRAQSWNLSTEVRGRQVTSAVVPTLSETWRGGDGSGRIRVDAAPPEFPDQRARQAWEEQGSPAPERRDETFGPGRLGGLYPPVLPGDQQGLRAALQQAHPVKNGPAEALVSVVDLYKEQTPGADVRAGVLDYLADVPGLTVQGLTPDRAGRQGLAVGLVSDMTGLPTRFTLVFDQRDGRLLSAEQTLTVTPGALNVPVPSVIDYVLFLDGSRTDDTAATG